MNGTISEVLVYNVNHTTTQRQEVEGYLAWKWGLQASLPAGHPYLSAAPTSSLGWNPVLNMIGATGPTGPSIIPYSAATAGNWATSAPTTLNSAIDRLAAAVSTLRGSAVP
jgi:hypothetical protein